MSKVALIILDGRGQSINPSDSAIVHAKTPAFDRLRSQYPHSELQASELAVGLPSGQVGNSEVGHTTLGAGRVLYQDIVKIQQAIDDRTLHQHPLIREASEYANAGDHTVHIMGLCSDGGVHSHIDHIKALVDACASQGAKNVVLHLFGDGRDTKPQVILSYIQSLRDYCSKLGVGRIGSIIGRYYAMDRDNRRERIAKAYHLLVNGQGDTLRSDDELASRIQTQYDVDITDEFLPAVMLPGYQSIQSGDVVIFANFRTDRAREITSALTQEAFSEYDMKPLNLKYVTMTNYDETFENIQVLYDKDNVSEGLGEIIEQHGKTQLRIAETEKYPHVTFFFSGGRESPYIGESRILIPSPKVATYDLEPAMSTQAIADALVQHMQTVGSDFVCCNFAAPDMVGHTGVRDAAIQACEAVDSALGQVVDAGLAQGYEMIIIADHGNIDIMRQSDGSPHTAHTLALVPCILVSPEYSLHRHASIRDGSLADIAPTILDLMGIPQPAAMTGKSLVS